MNACFHRYVGRHFEVGDAAAQPCQFALRFSPLILIVFIGCDRVAARVPRGAEAPTTTNPILVEVVELATPAVFTDETAVFGQLAPAQVSRLSFADAGRLGTMAVQSGQQVAFDTPLAQLDVTQLQEQRRRQVDAVQKYRSELASSARTPTQSSLDQLRGLESQLEQTDQRIEGATLRAPFAGRVGAIYVRPGQPVSGGAPVLELEDLSRPVVLAKLTSELARQRDTARVTADVDGQEFSLEAAMANNPENTDSSLARLQFSDGRYPNNWRAGQVTKLTFQTTDNSPGFRVPTSSLVQPQEQQWAVYIAVPDQQSSDFFIEQRRLDRVRYRGVQVIVEGNLARGDQVVTGGTHRIVPGQQVIPVRIPSRIEQLDQKGFTDGNIRDAAP